MEHGPGMGENFVSERGFTQRRRDAEGWNGERTGENSEVIERRAMQKKGGFTQRRGDAEGWNV